MSKTMSFVDYAETVVIPDAVVRAGAGLNAATLPRDYKQRLDCYCRPFFGTTALHRIDAPKMRDFRNYLLEKRKLKPTTALPVISFVSKTLTMAAEDGKIVQTPRIVRPPQKAKTRPWFTTDQYRKQLLPALHKIEKGDPAIQWKGHTVDWELRSLVTFLINSFLRPGDIFALKHAHITVVEQKPATKDRAAEHQYLRLDLPPSKGHEDPVISMPVAVEIYDRLLTRRRAAGLAKPDDYVFLPKQKGRAHAKKIVQRQFDLVLRHAGLKTDSLGAERTLYCLRHSCIMFRLLDAEGLDLLTLARNCRTSVEMIDRFYAKPLSAEMNRHQLFSSRRPNRSLAIGRPGTDVEAI